jgi:CDP-glucose 4,6-dehydratase
VTLVRDLDPQSELVRRDYLRFTSVVNGCLEDYRSVERAITEYEIEVVFHLGAQTIVTVANRSPLFTLESNIRGSYNLLEACRVHHDLIKAVIIASSDKAYGESKVLPYTEGLPLQGRHPYDVSKSCADLLATAYYTTYSVPIGIARCGNTYGGGDLNWTRLIPGTIRSLLAGERPVIRSDGQFIRDYVYVKEIVGAYLSLAEAVWQGKACGQAFNFSSQKPHTVLEVVAAIRSLMHREDLEPVILNSVHGEIHDQILDSSKAQALLGWQAAYSLDEGLGETIKWYEEYLDARSKAG